MATGAGRWRGAAVGAWSFVGLGLVTVVGLIWLLVLAPETHTDDELPDEARTETPLGIESAPESEPPETEVAPEEAVPSAADAALAVERDRRTELAVELGPRDTVWVRDAAGVPIEGAWVSRTPLDGDVLGFFQGSEVSEKLWMWRERSERIAARTVHGRTDRDGRVRLPAREHLGTQGEDSVLWVSHRSHTAQAKILPGEGDGESSIEFTLEPAAGARVRVSDGEGHPVAGASVRQLALWPLGLHPVDAPMEIRARRALVRADVTDAAGRLELEAISGRQLLLVEAQVGDAPQLAVVVLKDPRGEIDVQLEATFELSGQVRWTGPGGPGDWGFVSVQGIAGIAPPITLAAAHVGSDGSFGPVRVPLSSRMTAFRARFEHGELVPAEHEFAPPAPGEHVRVEFDTVSGFDFWLQTIDAVTSEPLADTRVVLFWDEPLGRAEGRTSAIGWTQFHAPREGEIDIIVRREGYGRQRRERIPVDPESWMASGLLLALRPAGKLSGTVWVEGEPASDFEVVVNPPGTGRIVARWPFVGRKDGSFEIDEIEPGDYIVRAVLPGTFVTGPASATIDLEREAVVRLEAMSTAEVTGRVLRMGTLEPMEGVGARLWLAERAALAITPLGPGERTDSAGRFRLPTAPLGHSMLYLMADSGERLLVPLPETAEGSVDLGDLLLTSRIPVEVVLEGEPGAPIGSYWVRSSSCESFSRFDADGRVTLLLRAGQQRVSLYHPEGPQEERWISDPGSLAGPLRVHVRPGQLRLRIEASAEDAEREGAYFMRYVDPDGRAVYRVGAAQGSEWRLPGVPSGRAELFAVIPDVELTANASLWIDETGAAEAVLDFAAGRRLRLLDRSGDAVPGAVLSIREVGAMGGEGLLAARVLTDEAGLFRLPGGAMDSLWLIEGSTSHGVRFGEIALPAVEPGAAPTDVAVDLDRRLTIELRELGEPIRGASIALFGTRGGSRLMDGNTDAAGRLQVGPSGLGEMRVELLDPRYFARATLAHPAQAGAKVTIEVYSRGDLDLGVFDSAGTPLSGAQVSLHHSDFDHPADAWIAQGRVSGNTVSDTQGRVRLSGLPRGRYRVQVQTPDGQLDGNLDLRPGETTTLTLRMP